MRDSEKPTKEQQAGEALIREWQDAFCATHGGAPPPASYHKGWFDIGGWRRRRRPAVEAMIARLRERAATLPAEGCDSAAAASSSLPEAERTEAAYPSTGRQNDV